MKKQLFGATAAVSITLLTVTGLSAAAAAPAEPATLKATKRYIVKTDSTATVDGLAGGVQRSGGDVDDVYSEIFSGFSATMTATQAQRLKSDRRVASVTADARVHTAEVQSNPTWGLDRTDQRATTGNRAYRYDTTGSGVTAFVVDTGVRFAHTQFGGRATSGPDFVDYDMNAADCDGHGTHVAGTVGGSTYGVAKKVKIVSVRALDCEGAGYYSDIIASLDWIVDNKPAGPAVVNMSIGGTPFTLLDQAVDRTVAAGIAVVVAAGNSGTSACGESPARAPRAITVSATSTTDTRPSWANYGSCVDLFAPGVGVRSASVAGNSTSEVLSGTSMAAPHVTGVVARYLQNHPRSTPSQTAAALLWATTPNVVKNRSGAPNRLLYASGTATAPAVVRTLRVAKNDTARTATVTWATPVSDGGKPVTGYRISRDGRSSTGVGPTVVTVSASSRSYTFTKLVKGTSYTMSARAVNAVGTSSVVSMKLAALR